jgi:hypothetical protein
MKLTPESIRMLAPVEPKTELVVFDDELPGFGVRARRSGSKAFIVQYSIGNRQRRISLGKVDLKDLLEVREEAKQILAEVRRLRK